jgi:hypothetical protein
LIGIACVDGLRGFHIQVLRCTGGPCISRIASTNSPMSSKLL